jgi:hypothetical protein
MCKKGRHYNFVALSVGEEVAMECVKLRRYEIVRIILTVLGKGTRT